MPWSWVRVSTKTSPQLGQCIGGDHSTENVRHCVAQIVAAAGGEVGLLDFEVNGKWARLRFEWENHEVKRHVIYDLQADHVIDILPDDERDSLLPRDP